MTSPTEPRTTSLYAFDPAYASGLAAMSVASFYLLASVIPRGAALVACQLVLVAIPVAATFATGKPLAAIGLRLPRARYVVGAILIGLTAWYLNMRVVMWLEPPAQEVRQLQLLVDETPLWQTVLLLAILPPICEEILFRGTLARGLATRLPGWLAVSLAAMLFSAYHLSLVQAVPTLTLGLALGLFALRADSVVPAIAAHMLNNGMAILVSRDLDIARWFATHPTPALVACAAGTTAGLAVGALA